MALTPIKAVNLSAPDHGFFTREGGVSEGIYAGLNCGLGSNDDNDRVHTNRELVAASFGLDKTSLVSVHQVHSPTAVRVTGPHESDPPKCDAMVTASKGVALGILTADCAPVLFEDKSAGVVGAAHSGWRGAIGGVLNSTIEAMIELGASETSISACVGPCISQRAYEVGPEFVEEFEAQDAAFMQYFASGNDDRAMFDLPRFVLDRLRDAGLNDVAWTGHCTYSDPQKFFSYRRTCHNDEADYGRLISVIKA
jgi:YfiH family protein